MTTQRARAQARLVLANTPALVPTVAPALGAAARPFKLTALDAPEAAIQDAVLQYLAMDRRIAWAHRFNTGAQVIQGTDAKGRKTRRFVKYAFPGCADVLGQLVTGQFMAVEIKTRTGRLSPEQRTFLQQVAAAGGFAVVARSVEDMQRALDAFFGHLQGSLHEVQGELPASPTRARAGASCPALEGPVAATTGDQP